ncbi:CBN-COL-68 protein [Aphelenchoides avenae]|nr:CBN-COL-68 protein [Aphelenchus avenae]
MGKSTESQLEDRIRHADYLKQLAFFGIAISTVATIASVIAVPLIYGHVQRIHSVLTPDLEYCRTETTKMWDEFARTEEVRPMSCTASKQMGITDQKRLRRHRLRRQAGYDPGVPVDTGPSSSSGGGSYAEGPATSLPTNPSYSSATNTVPTPSYAGSGSSDPVHSGSSGPGVGSLLQRPTVVSSRQSVPDECCCCGVGEDMMAFRVQTEKTVLTVIQAYVPRKATGASTARRRLLVHQAQRVRKDRMASLDRLVHLVREEREESRERSKMCLLRKALQDHPGHADHRDQKDPRESRDNLEHQAFLANKDSKEPSESQDRQDHWARQENQGRR